MSAPLTIIGNPRAGAGKGRALLDALAPLRSLGVEILETAGRGDAIGLVRRAAERGAREVVSLGGDGTHSEVVEGIVGGGLGDQVVLRPVHAGTGGDFRRLLEPFEPDARGLEAWFAGEEVRVDAVRMVYRDERGDEETRHFLNMCSFGLGGLVDRYVNRSSKRLGGKVSFLLSTVRAMAGWRPATVRLVADGVERGTHRITNVVVANGRYCGGGMHLAPEALLDDGLLDILVMPDAPMLRAARSLPRLYDGTVRQIEGVEWFRARTLTAELVGSSPPAWLDVDGEDLGVIPASFELLPGALRMRGPRSDVLSQAVPEEET